MTESFRMLPVGGAFKSSKAARRRVRSFAVRKADLLKMFIKGGVFPSDSRRIVGSGHNPREIIFYLSFSDD